MEHRRRTLLRAHGGDEDGRNAPYLRGFNLERTLLVAMDRQGPFTRAELIQATGLSAPTVGSLTSDLIRRGLIRDLGAGPSRGGRRPSFMEFNGRYGFVAGLQIASTSCSLAIADARGEMVAQDAVPTPADRGPGAVLSQLSAALRALLRQARVPAGRLLAVGVGAPGAVDSAHGVVMALAPDLKGWSQVPVAALLRKALGVPVLVENDVNLAVLGERWRGVARGHDTCAFIAVGTGIGAGVVVKGELHHGHHFQAGEIALMCMGPQFVESDFGARGCLETLVGLRALESRWARHAPSDAEPRTRALAEAARAGDGRARALLTEAATLIGIAAANLSVTLDPSLIVLGGELIAQAPHLIDDIRRIVARIVLTPGGIMESTLGKEAPLWGSVLIAMNEARQRIRTELYHGPATRAR
jgi:glucokinase